MSDRREAVAKAMLRDHLLRWDGTDDDFDQMWNDPVTYQEYLLQADAALAAMDAEPTDAEVEVACFAYAQNAPLRAMTNDGMMVMYAMSTDAMRAALEAFLAARKDRP